MSLFLDVPYLDVDHFYVFLSMFVIPEKFILILHQIAFDWQTSDSGIEFEFLRGWFWKSWVALLLTVLCSLLLIHQILIFNLYYFLDSRR